LQRLRAYTATGAHSFNLSYWGFFYSIFYRLLIEAFFGWCYNKIINCKNMVKGNFLGAAIVAIIYTVYILIHPLPKTQEVILLVALNALTIVLMSFAFK
jgi:hypothetical protein